MKEYNPKEIEAKRRRIWDQKKAWRVDLKKATKPYYNLMMFPYPSAEGLHIGNMYAFTGSDIYGRFQRLRGNDVFEPMGFDSFGIHSENFAIKQGTHPKEQTAKSIKHFTEQLKSMGALFDWEHSVTTSEPEYYKWTQWLFLQLYKAGLAYRAKAPVDWCPSCKTVLADEQVIQRKCERCGTEVIQRGMEQWFFRITKYADRLLKNLDTIDWSERTKTVQRNWIGKTEGATIIFALENSKQTIEVFTTRPDTLYGATFVVLAPEHPFVSSLPHSKEIHEYVEKTKQKTELERKAEGKEKTAVFSGLYAINPLNNEKLPIWIADYALMGYGTGALFGDAHDERDVEFAKKYNIPLKTTVVTGDKEKDKKILNLEECFTGYGTLVDSGPFTGLSSKEAIIKVIEWLVAKKRGSKRTTYHLRDWLISRQRYWGPPIPIIYCDKCGTVPVSEKNLPVKLPNVKDFRPTGTDKSPLATVASFVNTKCPNCKGKARRETDVSDTFLDSAWYFLRYPSANDKKQAFDKSLTKKWLPVNMYIGGQEHAVLHLLYARFITMVLRDLKFTEFQEPFAKFRAHGLLIRDGKKISKSRGNVINPDEYIEKYGADTVRTYLMFLGPLSEGGDWNGKGIIGIYRFLNRVWALAQKTKIAEQDSKLETLRHRTIKKVTEDMENLRYNTAIAALMEYSNALSQADSISKEQIKTLLILLAPFMPFVTEELWQQLGNKESVHDQKWPTYNPALVQEEMMRLVLQVNGKVRDVVGAPTGITEEEAKKLALSNIQIQKWLAGKDPKRIIFVPKRLINIVI
ncbi:MAG TPA: leucine--tRNA ligase [Candidatus Wildermuthbacteria bacterium]|uniref:Leucine--tRNA ligase n=1 Tax=Candidatus Yanofskybacteria bacterium GW2011_GWC1_48_11 TaxID=1619027 RepID=A0A837IQ60_9BACT|nr:MAG: Leucine-tRNA ligase [Candidatus Yanofskybacteria bacterium GW2011_GWC1_48_11]KKW04011.1 MAG: Leucine-tRNA ligase [Parcubacteria group bacterium GW2011_GWB1_49_12]KKW08888.1 MAG: Leucine-tRNA ligase [Parcubacteria group bacterium GW2011_GWA1_49_26]OHA61808.1 MAG: leucine--tRNA ligase [Candidatus Wildermuthbacteria bacterium GWA1_49_26]OHA65316.1 MAG: leucine--tRNA ligase [Candidatus Wildermuthbacteria bacterium RIFCSPHIGHO2_01_FULL_50_47]OHA69562.1 MAG: leucine--tRNA ligase [Candidatus 